MSEATRDFAITKTREILQAYINKIEDAKGYLDYIPIEGRKIVNNYDKNVDDCKILILEACNNEGFFSDMTDEMVLQYADVCYKLNETFDLNVKNFHPINKIVKDEKGFWDTIWGALQGEFNEDPTGAEILIDMGLNFIPFVVQACDVRDITACLKKLVVERRVNEVMIWVTLLLTAIGCIPYAGDVIKAGCKAVVKGADDIFLKVLRKLDAEDVYKAFKLFIAKFLSSIDDAIAMVHKWIEKAGNSKYGSKINDILSCASEKLTQATDFVKKQIDDFEQRIFKKGKGNGRLSKADNLKIDNINTKQFTTEPFGKDGKLKPNIKYTVGEHKYIYETDELGRICNCSADELLLKQHIGRLKHNPNTPGKLDGDHAGHLIADVFGGSPELDNLVSQAKNVNLKQYRDIEREWEKALRKVPPDEITDLKIEIIYNGNNARPTAFKIEYCINGKPFTPDTIPNS